MSVVYILINAAMPGLVKIGRAEDIVQRMKTLYQSGVPLPFQCVYAARVADPLKVEKNLHIAFAPHRINENREFFRIDPVHVAAALELAALENMTPGAAPVETQDDIVALEKETRRAARFNFEMVNIPAGAVLTFVEDNAITCTVFDKSRVTFEGEVTSLSDAALRALKKVGKVWKSAQGSNYWQYEGQTLVERREEMETVE